MNVRPIPLALYVHLPWCVRKCPYCDFNSHAIPAGGMAEQAYVGALLEDLEYAMRDVTGRPLVSVFFGGGTPSLFSAQSIARILARAEALVGFAPDVEITLEANPGAVEHGRFVDFAAAGVNRVSIGAQSFNDARLAALGRIHGAHEIARAVDELRQAGIENFNLDLMYALPGQDVAGAIADLEQGLALEPAHVSHYELTLEPATPFAKHPPAGLPDDDLAWEMQLQCQARLAANGFEHYEVSAYARPGRRARHNLVYWEFGDYLGIGAGAHGKLTVSEPTLAIVRTARVRHPATYLAATVPGDRVTERRAVAAEELPFEYVLNALRLHDGFAAESFSERTGLSAAALEEPVRRAETRGLLEQRNGCWRATALGRRFLNDLQALFLPR